MTIQEKILVSFVLGKQSEIFDWVPVSIDELKIHFGWNRTTQNKIIEGLEKTEIIERENKGLPMKRYIRVLGEVKQWEE